MAKGNRDIILRDRLQFDITNDLEAKTTLVYGRIDLSDYVNIVKNDGLAIKEVRIQLRDSDASSLGVVSSWMGTETEAGVEGISGVASSYLKVFATTTAYENDFDVGIASPNVLMCYERQFHIFHNTAAPANTYPPVIQFHEQWFGTPDLHPEGYDVVTDLLIGVSAQNMDAYKGETLDIDVMLIAEPKKISKADLTDMLTQAQDL
jgi:hypothetical protein